MENRSIIVSACALAGLFLAGCQTAPAAANSDGSDATMRAACTERAAAMYGVAAAKVELPPSFGTGDTGNKILNGQVDKGPEGFKEFRCIYDATNALVDVMAMTPDGE
jgi:hypothetical protein